MMKMSSIASMIFYIIFNLISPSIECKQAAADDKRIVA